MPYSVPGPSLIAPSESASTSPMSAYPWRSVDGYVGHSPWVQFLALISVAALAASLWDARAIRLRPGDDQAARDEPR